MKQMKNLNKIKEVVLSNPIIYNGDIIRRFISDDVNICISYNDVKNNMIVEIIYKGTTMLVPITNIVLIVK